MLVRVASGMVAAISLAVAAAPAQAAPEVFAHRGGPYVRGKPTFPENTLPAFGLAALQGDPLEFDVKLTSDGVPVVIHDPTLDRTTNCTGRVVDKTLAQLRKCKADVLGVPEAGLPVRKVADPSVGIPTLSDVLKLARRTGSTIVPEIKNYPTDSDFDSTPAFATTVVNALGASGIPVDRIVVQSFTTQNLDVVQAQLPGAQTSLLALSSGNDAAIPLAATRGYTWVSPQWPVDSAYVAAAHAAGRKVVPYTIDVAQDMVLAAATGADALITNDPTRAREAVGAGFPVQDDPESSATSSKVKVKSGVASVKVECNSIASQTCVGNLLLTVRHKGVAGRAQFAIAGGKTQSLKVGVRRGITGKGTVAIGTYDDRGLPAVGRQSITLG
jgi:glycerophosphoryl diester phosphodiesterase